VVDNEEQLRYAFEAASRRIKQQLNGSKGGSQAEAEYSIAYQNLVKSGIALQIKRKYR
jgi:hypothetical protein